MSFVALGGDGSARPTTFELVAAERMMPSLKAATIYSLSVFAQRRPQLHRLLDWEDELFAVLTALLDRLSLAGSNASFAESLYGLRRAQADPDQGAASSSSSSSSDGGAVSRKPLSSHLRRVTLLLLVVLPYVKAKLDRLYSRCRPRHDTLLGLGAFQRQRQQQQQQDQQQGQQAQAPVAQRLRRTALQVFLMVYPWAHAATEGLKFAYQLLYLLDSSAYYSPTLHLLRQRIVRISGQELVEAERAKARHRSAALAAARESATLPLSWLRQGYLRANWALSDHTRNALILSVFAFKLLEWWYTSAEDKFGGSQALPPPPPPRPPPPHPQGLPLPPDPSTCPICLRLRTNPATVAVSGYVFCYPCIFPHVRDHGCCPVTRIPASVDHIRRLYQSA